MTIKQREIIMKAADNTIFSRSRFEVEKFLNVFLRGKEEVKDADLIFALINEENNNALLPEELRTDIEVEKKNNKSIRKYIDIVPVTTLKGTYSTESEENTNNELIDFENEDNFELAEQDLKFNAVNWNIRPRGSFTAVDQSFVEDITYNLTKLFEKNHAEKAVKTENKLVFNALKEGLSVKTLTDINALTSSLNKDINPALEKEVVIITNQDGYETLKPNLEFFKDEEGKVKAYLDKYLVETYSNSELKSTPGTVPVIYGSLKRSVKLFDLERIEMMLVRYPFGIRSRISVMRGIENFDVKLIPNSTQTIYAELTVS